MQKKPTHSISDVIPCSVCLTEIPRDLAKSEEASGYVHYFCGAHCYTQWKQVQRKTDEPKKSGG